MHDPRDDRGSASELSALLRATPEPSAPQGPRRRSRALLGAVASSLTFAVVAGIYLASSDPAAPPPPRARFVFNGPYITGSTIVIARTGAVLFRTHERFGATVKSGAAALGSEDVSLLDETVRMLETNPAAVGKCWRMTDSPTLTITLFGALGEKSYGSLCDGAPIKTLVAILGRAREALERAGVNVKADREPIGE